MRQIIYFVLGIILFTSCSSDSSQLEKMIPATVEGFIQFDIPSILKEGEFSNENDEFSTPQIIDEFRKNNPTSFVNDIISQYASSGISGKSKAYVFYTKSILETCVLLESANTDQTTKWIEKATGEKLSEKDDIEYTIAGQSGYFLKDNVLLYTHITQTNDKAVILKEANKILRTKKENITTNETISGLIKSEKSIVASFTPKLLLKLSKGNNMLNNICQKFPLLRLMSESDITAITLTLDANKDNITIESNAISPNKESQFAKFIESIETKPSSDILEPFPNSMDYIASVSIKGNSILNIPEINDLLNNVGKMPYIHTVDFKSIVNSINGPIAVGISKDQTFQDEHNIVIAVKSDTPDLIINQILKFGKLVGQNPEKKNDEYIYEYMNRPVRVGVNKGIVYVKILDYEQTEPSISNDTNVKGLFSKSPTSLFAHAKDNSGKSLGALYLGSVSPIKYSGKYIPANGYNAIQSLFLFLGEADYSTEDNSTDSNSDFIPIDKMEEI